jgi:hypothetical protein
VYIRLYPCSENRSTDEKVKKSIPKVRFLTADGVEVTPDTVKAAALASEFPEDKKRTLCMTILTDHIVQIGKDE